MFKYTITAENIENPFINQFSHKTYAQFSDPAVYTNLRANLQNNYYTS